MCLSSPAKSYIVGIAPDKMRYPHIFIPQHRMMPGHIVFPFSVRDPVRLRLRHLYQVEFCSFIVRYPTAGASVYCGHIFSSYIWMKICVGVHIRSTSVRKILVLFRWKKYLIWSCGCGYYLEEVLLMIITHNICFGKIRKKINTFW